MATVCSPTTANRWWRLHINPVVRRGEEMKVEKGRPCPKTTCMITFLPHAYHEDIVKGIRKPATKWL